MMIARGVPRPVLGIAAIAVIFAAAAVLSSDDAQVESEAKEPGMTSVELERRPIPGTDLEMRMDLVTQFPGYSGPVD